MKLPKLMTERTLLKCLFYYFKVCGAAPISFDVVYNNHSKANRLVFSSTTSDIVYNLLLISSIVALDYLGIYRVFYETDISIGFDVKVYLANIIAAIFNTTCIILILCVQHSKQVLMFNKMSKIKEIISDSSTNLNALLKKFAKILIVSGIIWAGLSISILMYDLNYASLLFSLTLCKMIRYALTLEYCAVLNLMQALFAVINSHLSGLLIPYNLSRDGVLNVNAMDNKLSQLWESYSLLSQLSQDVSDFYSLPMLLNILCGFLLTTTALYTVAKPIVVGGPYLTAFDYANTFLFVIIYLYPLVLLSTSVSNVIRESRKTRETVNNLLRRPETRIVKDKLNQISIYLLHDHVKFAVFDLFSLDGSLLVSVAGTITTYLMILLQFQTVNKDS